MDCFAAVVFWLWCSPFFVSSPAFCLWMWWSSGVICLDFFLFVFRACNIDILHSIALYCNAISNTNLWQVYISQANRCHFSSSVFSFHIATPHFGNFCNISNFFIIIFLWCTLIYYVTTVINIFVLYFKLSFINIFKHTATAHLMEHTIDMTLIHSRKPKICVTSFIEVTWNISEICLYRFLLCDYLEIYIK